MDIRTSRSAFLGGISKGRLHLALAGLAALSFTQADRTERLPPLPKVPFVTFASPARELIGEAYSETAQKPEDAKANGELGMLLYAYEQFEFAETCFERARALDPSDSRWDYYAGRTQAELGKYEEAALSLQSALKKQGGYLPARLSLGECLFSAGKLDASLKVFESILADHPESAAAYYGIGRIRAARKETAAAADLFRKACELFPPYGAAHYALALAYRDLGEKDKAREHLALYNKDKLAWPPTPDPLLKAVGELKTGASTHLKRGVSLEAAGKIREAVEEHEKALEADPEYVQAHINLITLCARLGEPEKAEQHYRAAVAVNPNLAEAHYNFGVLMIGQQRQEEAAEAFRRALEINPNYAEAHNNYGITLMTSGQLDEAAEHFRTAIKNRPSHKLAHFNLGRILIHQGRLQEAIDHFLQTLTPEDDQTPTFTYALAAAYARAGNRQEALKYMRDAREKAAAGGQSKLLQSIEKDLQILERGSGPP